MKICFATHSNHGEAILDPEYCEKSPVGGSETAVIKMAQSLQKLGAEVSIATKPSQLPSSPVDVFVAARLWNMFREKPAYGKLNYLWCQDDIDQASLVEMTDPAVARQVYQNCDGLIMLSHYQAYRWITGLHAPAQKIFYSSNGIDLPRFQIDSAALIDREPHCYFASTPFRGLADLLYFWPTIRAVIGARARLTICSSLKVYAAEEEAKYEALYEKARTLEGVDYVGSVGQQRLREISASCRALAYPCRFPETSCIAAMEAMASGCVVVSTALGALPETAWRNPLVPLGESWGDLWIEELLRVLTNESHYALIANENLKLAQLMGWQDIARKWMIRFQSDLAKQAWASQNPSPA
jgi:glycosyltransferase involved in cell wall biosynthesis